jgi:hypothetical protein
MLAVRVARDAQHRTRIHSPYHLHVRSELQNSRYLRQESRVGGIFVIDVRENCSMCMHVDWSKPNTIVHPPRSVEERPCRHPWDLAVESPLSPMGQDDVESAAVPRRRQWAMTDAQHE